MHIPIIWTLEVLVGGIIRRQTTLSARGILALYGLISGFEQTSLYAFYFISTASFWLYLQPFTLGFPRADIHELLSADLLHQVIKGTFKDHIVMWVNEYLTEEHGETAALAIVADIDHR
jgi:Plavaka transposase